MNTLRPSLPPIQEDRGELRLLKRLIWTYFWLWVLEGALRKWIIPQLSNPLLLIRDPVVISIYFVAIRRRKAGSLALWTIMALLTVGMIAVAVANEQADLWVPVFGLRSNLLHVPLIFVIADTFDVRDVDKFARIVLRLTFPLIGLAVLQFYAPLDSFLNFGAGASSSGQMGGALDRVRPPSVFSFNGGFVFFLALALYFSLEDLVSREKRNARIAWLRFGLILLGFGISVSRAAVITGALTFLLFILVAGRHRNVSRLFGMFYFLPVLLIGLSFLAPVRDGLAAFAERWTQSTSDSQTTAYEGIVLRTWQIVTGFTDEFDKAGPFGHGLGLGTNVGAYLTTGSSDFLLAENELERLILELGPYIGLAYILFRVGITVYIGGAALRAYRRGDPRPAMLFWICAPSVVIGQWGVTTIQGITIFVAGLTLASCRTNFRARSGPVFHAKTRRAAAGVT